MNKSDEKTDVAKATVSDISIDMLLNIHDICSCQNVKDQRRY